MKTIFSLCTILLLLSSCSKEELALAPPTSSNNTTLDSTNLIPKGVLVSNTVHLKSDYSRQVWFNLGTNTVVKTNLRTDWDLAFDCGESNVLYLNSALTAGVAFTGEIDFEKVNSDKGLNYINEHHSGKKDSLAIGDISHLKEVLIIDRGFNPQGQPLGKFKIQINKIENNVYNMTYSQLDGSNKNTASIAKVEGYNRIAFSFNSNETIQIEPPKLDYDLCFTQYTYTFIDPPIVYSVNGAIINPYKTSVAKIFNKEFSKITLEDVQSIPFQTHLDVIGHHWKDYNIDKGEYTVFVKQNYIVKDSQDNFYKLHFLDFYDENGLTGSPSFEYMRL